MFLLCVQKKLKKQVFPSHVLKNTAMSKQLKPFLGSASSKNIVKFCIYWVLAQYVKLAVFSECLKKINTLSGIFMAGNMPETYIWRKNYVFAKESKKSKKWKYQKKNIQNSTRNGIFSQKKLGFFSIFSIKKMIFGKKEKI